MEKNVILFACFKIKDGNEYKVSNYVWEAIDRNEWNHFITING